MAETIFKDIIIDEYQKKRAPIPIEVISAGTHATDGLPASRFAVETLSKYNLNLNFHHSRHLSEKIALRSNLILTMESAHKNFILYNYPNLTNVYELKHFGRNSEDSPKDSDIADPMGMDIHFYDKIFNEIKNELLRISPIIFNTVSGIYNEN